MCNIIIVSKKFTTKSVLCNFVFSTMHIIFKILFLNKFLIITPIKTTATIRSSKATIFYRCSYIILILWCYLYSSFSS
nr:MAG TPA: hypothetical protein [Caudoviricetes sp.]